MEESTFAGIDLDIGVGQTNQFGDRFFSNLNPDTFYKSSAAELYDAEFAAGFLRANMLHIIVGTDSGLLPHYLMSKEIPDGSRYIFIEPSSILVQLQEMGVLSDLDERIVCVDEDSWLEAAAVFRMNDYFFINAVISYNSLAAQNNIMGAYAEFSWSLVELLQQLYYQVSASTATEAFMTQQLRNLADNRIPAAVLKSAFKGATAFVLAGGPSLDEALEWVKEHRQSIVLFAVSRVARRLLQVGLEPDFIVSVDPFPANFEVSKEIFSFSSKPVLICANHVYPELINQWHGRVLYLESRLPWESSLNEANLFANPPTVTNTAVGVAYQLGCTRIFLAGANFCYTLQGVTHAQGSREFAAGARFSLTNLELETYSGAMAPTGLDYSFARDMLEAQVQPIIASNQCQLFNISAMAAKVKGVEYMPLSSIVLDDTPLDIEPILDKHLAPAVHDSFFTKANLELERVLHQLNKIKQLATQALECNEGLYNAEGIIEDFKEKARLDKLEKVLRKKYRIYSRLVQVFGLRRFLRITKPFDDDVATAEEVKWRLRVYYESYIYGATQLISLLEQAQHGLAMRAEEQKERPDWLKISAHSRVEKSFGRVRLWRTLTKNQHFSVEQEAVFAEFERIFSESLAAWLGENSHPVQQSTDLSVVNARAQLLFKYNKTELLHNLLGALEKQPDTEAVLPYRHLIQGYLAELEGGAEQALQEYQQILDLGTEAIEEALLRIVSLDFKSGSGELAHQSLECLAQLNTRYSLFYARSCRVRGLIVDAIDTYIAYLALFPDDLRAQLQLAQLYLDQRIYDGAKMMLEYILLNNPGQERALLMKKTLDALLKDSSIL